MPALCCYFEVHHPLRVKAYDAFHVGHDRQYFDVSRSAAEFRKVATRCYLPANAALLRLVERHEGDFRFAYSITGTTLEQLRLYCPEALTSFQRLADTGCVEFLSETSHHSLAALYDPAEFTAQVDLHRHLTESYFGQRPRVFRNTELIYDDTIGRLVADLGFDAMLAEGADDLLEGRSPHFVYSEPSTGMRLLLRNYRLSGDLALRSSTRSPPGAPFTPEPAASWLDRASGGECDVVNLFMDYATFSRPEGAETCALRRLDALARDLLPGENWHFLTPSQVIARHPVRGPLAYGRTTSWADAGRDLTAWRGNTMQASALAEVYSLGQTVRERNNPALVELWRKLQASEHFHSMSTERLGDGEAEDYFPSRESPYDAFIHYRNILKDLREHVLGCPARPGALVKWPTPRTLEHVA